MIRCFDILCRVYFKLSAGKPLHLPGEFFSVIPGKDLAFFIYSKLTLYCMVFKGCLDDHIFAKILHPVRSVIVHQDLKALRIECVSIRRVNFLDPVFADRQMLCQDQGSFIIREIGSVLYRIGIGRYLLHIALVVHVIDLKLRIRKKDCLLCFIILLDDLKLCLELLIQHHAPYLRRVRKVLCDGHGKIIHRIEVMDGCRLLYDILSVRNRYGQGISFVICE